MDVPGMLHPIRLNVPPVKFTVFPKLAKVLVGVDTILTLVKGNIQT
jgi:hypothetical protein